MSQEAVADVAFALGSNVGDKAAMVTRAARLLEDSGIAQSVRLSRLYRTEPWGGVPQDWFVNACAIGTTRLPALDLLRRIKALEVALGRIETVRWGPRVIDIDILYRGDDALDTPALTLPHRGLAERAFVLVPLADLAPDRIVGGETVAVAAARLDRRGVVGL